MEKEEAYTKLRDTVKQLEAEIVAKYPKTFKWSLYIFVKFLATRRLGLTRQTLEYQQKATESWLQNQFSRGGQARHRSNQLRRTFAALEGDLLPQFYKDCSAAANLFRQYWKQFDPEFYAKIKNPTPYKEKMGLNKGGSNTMRDSILAK